MVVDFVVEDVVPVVLAVVAFVAVETVVVGWAVLAVVAFVAVETVVVG